MDGQLAQLLPHVRCQDEILESNCRLDPPGQALEAGRVLGACAGAQILGLERPPRRVRLQTGRT